MALHLNGCLTIKWIAQKLGHGNNGLPDDASGLYQQESDIAQLSCGDVALFKK